MTQGKWIETAGQVLMENYRQQPAVFVRGVGTSLFDADGNEYLDMTAGIAVCTLGHCHPALSKAIASQASQLMHTSNLYYIAQQIRAAENITSRCFGERVFFGNSGAEANEAALKLARRYQSLRGEGERQTFLSTRGSFHGRSFATLSVTGQPKYQEGFGQLVGPVEFVEFGDSQGAIKAMKEHRPCAFIVEPVQAEGGIRVPADGYLQAVREAATETGTVLIFDEVQTGMGRLGQWFGHQAFGVEPDVMTLAKGLGGGIPVGAVVAKEPFAKGLAFVEGQAVPHASTFGGNPLACAAANAVFDEIERSDILENVRTQGSFLQQRLEELVTQHSLCEAVRGEGLLRGLVVNERARDIYIECRRNQLLVSIAGGNVIRFAPALNVGREDLQRAVDILSKVLSNLAG